MAGYESKSYWLESVEDDLTPRPPLNGSREVDIAILGAGYTGLWTAYYLLKRDPSLNVAVVEKEIAGYGASGRNGGWCSAGFPLSLSELERRYGRDAALLVHREMVDTVDEVGRVAQAEGIDCDFAKGGALRLARGKHQLPTLERSMETYRHFGIEDHYTMLSKEEADERVQVSNVEGAIFTPDCAVIHPGKLVRGLARVVEKLGGVIYEQTEVFRYEPGPNPVLYTNRGNLKAETIVIAGESFLSQMDQFSRSLIPLYSLIVLTEPLEDAQWERIGWESRECVSSSKYVVDYLSKTKDGRILFGGRGAPYHFGSKIRDEYDHNERIHTMLRESLLEWFPAVRLDQITHAWGGSLGMPRDWMPTMSYDPRTGVARAGGYTGQGVATANLSGRTLTDLITQEKSDLTLLPTVGHKSPQWEPEPLRYLGIRYIQEMYFRLDDKAAETGIPPDGSTLAERLSRH
ncbi:MAG: NAD(P)/FAD-dependent oxidoreductase [Chloroflexota bacterium]